MIKEVDSKSFTLDFPGKRSSGDIHPVNPPLGFESSDFEISGIWVRLASNPPPSASRGGVLGAGKPGGILAIWCPQSSHFPFTNRPLSPLKSQIFAPAARSGGRVYKGKSAPQARKFCDFRGVNTDFVRGKARRRRENFAIFDL